MRRHHRLLVPLLLAGVFGGFAVLPVDLPETAFDESDAPVSLAPPSTLLSFVPSCYRPIVMPGLRFSCPGCVVGSRVIEAAAMPPQRHSHYSLQDLLSDLKAVPLVQNARIFNAGTCSARCSVSSSATAF